MKIRLKSILLILIPLSIIAPIAFIFKDVFAKNTEYLNTLIENDILASYLMTTFELILKVMIASMIIGFGSAYINTMYDYKFKQVFNLLLILPLAIPVYVGAYTYELIYYDFGILEKILKNDLTLNGSVFIYTIFLYPYVYLASRSYLKRNLVEYIEASKTLGKNKFLVFIKIVLPLSWPAIFGASLFVVFETLSDFAVVDYYGVETISKIIKDSWRIGENETAGKVSMLLLSSLFVMIFFEKFIRRNKRYNGVSNKAVKRIELNVWQTIAVYLAFGIVISLGVILPIREMITNVIMKREYINFEILSVVFNTIITIIIALVVILVVGAVYSSIINSLRKRQGFFGTFGVIGYSIPSLILAIGVYTIALKFDKQLVDFLGLDFRLLTGTRIALIIALAIKFLSMSFTTYSNTLGKVSKSVFEAPKTLGKGSISSFLKVNVPLLKSTTPFVIIIVFIDLIKELTLTYSLRPFNFKTLSTEVYRYAGNEMIEVAAIPSLIIVICAVVLIVYMEVGMKNVKNK